MEPTEQNEYLGDIQHFETGGTPLSFVRVGAPEVPLFVWSSSRLGYNLIRFTPAQCEAIDRACQKLGPILLESEQPITMKEAIRQAAEAGECPPELLCDALLAYGICWISQRYKP